MPALMTITICVGSSCHLKGSRRIVEQLQSLVAQNDLTKNIELTGAFCLERCTDGVSVKIDNEDFSLQPENTTTFFEREVLKRVTCHE
jgi:NADH:ubiquinone oxidoreductase subunit E